MALVDRLAHDPGVESIANHDFSAACYFWALGEITRQNVVDAFNLSTEDQVQLDQLQTYYQGLNTADKQEFHSRLEAAGMLLEGEHITKAFYKNLLGLT